MAKLFRMKYTLISVFFLIPTLILSQTKVQKLYKAQKHKRCLKLCEKNITANKEKQVSILYKSLILCKFPTNDYVIKKYPSPVLEALKGLTKLEKRKVKKPRDKFYSQNKKRIKLIYKNILSLADTFLINEDIKKASKIYKKLYEIYPNDNVLFFHIAKTYDFKVETILNKLNDISKVEIYSNLYEIISNNNKYLKNNGKFELENALEKLYLQEKCDLEIASTMLVFLKQNYKISKKAKLLSEKFQKKYWQIDMLIKVNKKRANGYTCGKKSIKQMPPLVLDNCLVLTAQKYAELMKETGHYSHTSPDGKSPWTRANDKGCSADAENIAAGYTSAKHMLNGWLHSPGHCRNIMGNHTHMGIGETGAYWVQMFR